MLVKETYIKKPATERVVHLLFMALNTPQFPYSPLEYHQLAVIAVRRQKMETRELLFAL